MTRASASLLLAIATTVVMLVPAPLAAADQPVTEAADSLRTGWYPDEAQLTPQLLQSGGFGRVFDTHVQGQVYAQPLVSGDTLLAATEENWIYGIDPQSGAIEWSRSVGPPWSIPSETCDLPGPDVGITGTPVIDPGTDAAYFVSRTYQEGTSGPGIWKMHAIDLSTGEEEPNFPVQISGEAQNFPGVEFEPDQQLQRPALLLMNGVVYAAFGSFCDRPHFQGWIVGVSTAGQIKTMWATSPAGASIWQGGGGLVSDGEGQILFATGNGDCSECEIGGSSPPPGPGNEPPEELGESVVRAIVQPGGSLKATDFFSPFNNVELDEEDTDLGSGAPLGLPSPYFGTEAIPHLLVEVGKSGDVYLLNRDDLGGMGQGMEPEGSNDVVQEIPGTGGLWGSMAAWPGDGGYVYIPSVRWERTGGSLEVLKYGSDEEGNPHLSLVAKSSENLGYRSGSPLVTSNGTAAGSGIVWVSECPEPPDCMGSRLDAYAAVPVGGSPQLLWSGDIGVSTRFARPEASEGHIYVGTFDGHILGFGPTPAATFGPSTHNPTVTKPPKRAGIGRAIAARLARVRRGRALLRLRCPGAVPCRGTVKLIARIKLKRHPRRHPRGRARRRAGRVLLGRSRLSVAAGRAKTIRVRLHQGGRSLLRRARRHRHRLRARLVGSGVKHRTVVLKQVWRRRR